MILSNVKVAKVAFAENAWIFGKCVNSSAPIAVRATSSLKMSIE
jgi:hypothetical protein